nr:hypothetical protein CFP56_52734 [Quercus suber]
MTGEVRSMEHQEQLPQWVAPDTLKWTTFKKSFHTCCKLRSVEVSSDRHVIRAFHHKRLMHCVVYQPSIFFRRTMSNSEADCVIYASARWSNLLHSHEPSSMRLVLTMLVQDRLPVELIRHSLRTGQSYVLHCRRFEVVQLRYEPGLLAAA